jgi:hypothetical protein
MEASGAAHFGNHEYRHHRSLETLDANEPTSVRCMKRGAFSSCCEPKGVA